MAIFTHILQKENWNIESFCYNIVENHYIIMIGDLKFLFFLAMHIHSCIFFLKNLSPDVLYGEHSITYELNILKNITI